MNTHKFAQQVSIDEDRSVVGAGASTSASPKLRGSPRLFCRGSRGVEEAGGSPELYQKKLRWIDGDELVGVVGLEHKHGYFF